MVQLGPDKDLRRPLRRCLQPLQQQRGGDPGGRRWPSTVEPCKGDLEAGGTVIHESTNLKACTMSYVNLHLPEVIIVLKEKIFYQFC
jgi:hypothetical protein